MSEFYALPTEPEAWAFAAVVIGLIWRGFFVLVGRSGARRRS